MWQTKHNLTKYILIVVNCQWKSLNYEKDKINGFHIKTELETILIFLKSYFFASWGYSLRVRKACLAHHYLRLLAVLKTDVLYAFLRTEVI